MKHAIAALILAAASLLTVGAHAAQREIDPAEQALRQELKELKRAKAQEVAKQRRLAKLRAQIEALKAEKPAE